MICLHRKLEYKRTNDDYVGLTNIWAISDWLLWSSFTFIRKKHGNFLMRNSCAIVFYLMFSIYRSVNSIAFNLCATEIMVRLAIKKRRLSPERHNDTHTIVMILKLSTKSYKCSSKSLKVVMYKFKMKNT